MSQVGSQSLVQKLQSFLFRHWEKMVFGLAALGFLAFVYFGRAKSFTETTPRMLDDTAKQADRYVQDSTAWQKISQYRQGDRTAVATIQNERAVKPEWYQVSTISGTPMKTRGLRSDPEIKPPIDPHAELLVSSVIAKKPRNEEGNYQFDYWGVLEKRVAGTTGAAPTAVEDDSGTSGGGGFVGGGGGKGKTVVRQVQGGRDKDEEVVVLEYPEIQRQEEEGVALGQLGVDAERHTPKVVAAVCVTGLFPHELEIQEFNRCFMDSISYSAERDKPQYVKLEIQRRKMVDGTPGEWEDVTDFVTQVLPREFYAGQGPEIVEEGYVDPILTMRTPPFVFSNYKSFIAHSKVPVMKVDEPIAKPSSAAAAPTTVKLENLGGARHRGEAAAETPADAEKAAAEAGYKLIRFFDMFDFNVEPQSKVQYRFRVWVADPNMYDAKVVARLTGKGDEAETGEGEKAGAPAGGAGEGAGTGGKGKKVRSGQAAAASNGNSQVDFLQLDPAVRDRLRKLEAEKFPAGEDWKRYCRASDWSPETEWIGLPRNASEVFAGRVEYPNPAQSQEGVVFLEAEPEVDVAVRKWDRQLQVPVTAAQKVARASVINFKAKGVAFNPINRKMYQIDRDLDNTDEKATPTGVDFETESFVVDLMGGQKMPFSSPEKSYYFPSEILVMDANGEVHLRNASRDKRAYRHNLYEPDEALVDLQPKKPDPAKGPQETVGRGGANTGQ